MLDIQVTYEQAKALSALGIEDAIVAVKNYSAAYHDIVSVLSDIEDIVRLHTKTDGFNNTEDMVADLTRGIEIINKSTQDENNRKYFWTRKPNSQDSLEYFLAISSRFEFIIRYKDNPGIVEEYFELYSNDIPEYISYIWRDIELRFGDM